tara:strand:- start:2 stop:523 length:522 start_codon:yes stop_codon:yes gene_type:complete
MTRNQQVKTIAEEIKESVRPLMAKWVDDRIVYLLKSRTWMQSQSTQTLIDDKYFECKGFSKYFMRSDARRMVYSQAGIGKGDQQLIAYYGQDDWLIKAQKDAEQKLLKIEVAVFKKVNFDVDSVEKLSITEGRDGYMEGAWKLNNDKVFSFETFYAGGYNIQCLHVRTKYKLK